MLALLALWGCTSDTDDTGDTGPCAGAPYTDWFVDSDDDGFGNADDVTQACQAPAGRVADNTDCDDDDPAVNPDATEICGNEADDDCDNSPGICGAQGWMSAATGGATLLGSGDAGRSVAGVGDVDGDGLDDIVIGAPETEGVGAGSGVATLFTGSPSGELTLAEGGALLSGSSGGDRAGFAVAGAGDLNQDGFDDVLIGAPHSEAGGTAYLVYGPAAGGVDLESQAARVWAAQIPDDRAGQTLAGGQDVSGDGVPDVLIGAPEAGRGLVYLLEGPTSATDTLTDADAVLESEQESPSTGFALAMGDLDGDGLADVLMGAPQDSTHEVEAGAVYLFNGGLAGVVSTDDAALSLHGEQALDWAGSALAAGDLNGDGLDDVIVGAYRHDGNNTQSGAAYVLFGPLSGGDLASADLTLLGSAEQEHAGISVCVVGDHDGDGHADLLVGADRAGDDHGGGYLLAGPLVSGETALSDFRAVILGPGPGDRLGTSVAAAGDVDGDGTADILLGAPLHGDGGAAFLIQGGPGY